MKKGITSSSKNKSLEDYLEEYYPHHNSSEREHIIRKENTSIVKLVINFQTRCYEFVSDNCQDIFGVSPEMLKTQSLDDGFSLLWAPHQEIFYNEILPIVFEGMTNLIKDRKDVLRSEIVYNICMQHHSGKLISTTHCIMPISRLSNGVPLLAEKYIFLSHDNVFRNLRFLFRYKTPSGSFETIVEKEFPCAMPGDSALSPREKTIYDLVKAGFSSKEIADKLSISLHTVNNHRKNILAKYGARSIWHT